MNIGRENSPTRRPGARPRLFISYRRRSDSPSARLLKEGLTRAFGEGAVFRDVDDIEPGDAFPQSIGEAVESCDVFLLLVSPDWVESAGSLRNPDDFVRLEIAAALARRVPLIPVLLGGARMPKADELPEEIRDLAFRQALELSDSRWDYDVERLVKHIRARAPRPEAASFFGRAAAASRRFFFGTWPGKATAAAVLLAAVAGISYAIWHVSHRDLEGCVSLYAPDSLGGVGRIESGSYDSPVVRADEYHTIRERRHDPGGVPLMLRLSDSGHEVGVVFFRFFKADEIDQGVFKVERVIEPPCSDVQQYLNDDRPAGDKHVLKNWDRLRVRLGGRDYILRPGDHDDRIVATLTPAPGTPPSPWR